MVSNINSFLNWSQNQLAGVHSPRLDSEILLAHTLKLSRTQLRTQFDRVLNDSEKNLAKKYVQRRRNREPVSQIVGYQEFWSLNFAVDKNVLTPRPETEILIETALSCPSHGKILDLGTGSGVLAVVMAKEVPGCEVVALELDPKALSIARENAKVHGVDDRVEFICGDLIEEDWRGNYSMILSNPPYIPSADIQKIMPEVQNYEPLKALDGGLDGLDFYHDIIPKARNRLEKNGYLILEIGHSQADDIKTIFQKSSGFKNIQVIQDYSGYDRVIKAKKESSDG